MEITKLTKQLKAISDQYAKTYNLKRTHEWYLLKIQEELGELTQSYLRMKNVAPNKGKSQIELEQAFKEEVADVICHTLLLADQNNINVEQIIQTKWLNKKTT